MGVTCEVPLMLLVMMTAEITVEVVGKMIGDGVMITLDSPTTCTAGKLHNA